MNLPPFDPTYKNALREALVILFIFVLALVYSLTVCSVWGYNREAGEIETIGGIPDWVFWGVFVPWTICVPTTAWFCFAYMKDDPLEEPGGPGEDPAESAPDGPA